MATNSCANCNTANTANNPLKLCGACKTIGYCNRACQKANWKAHKSSCHQLKATGDKNGMSEASLRNINETFASLQLPQSVRPLESLMGSVPP
jgi:hypothetical protein